MKVQIEDISPIKKKIQFEVEPEAYRKALDKAYEKLKKKVNIKGFRKGKAPRQMLEQTYRPEAVEAKCGRGASVSHVEAAEWRSWFAPIRPTSRNAQRIARRRAARAPG